MSIRELSTASQVIASGLPARASKYVYTRRLHMLDGRGLGDIISEGTLMLNRSLSPR